MFLDTDSRMCDRIVSSHACVEVGWLTLLPLRLPVLLIVFEDTAAGDGVLWKYTSLGRRAVSDWVERFLWTCSGGSLTL